jgi:DNA invertase Pin-like site-specific DNA recombinase
MQKLAIERGSMARGHAVGTWYAEKASAKTIARPELDRLRADARAGHVHKLFVYRLDRLARSGIRDTFEVVEELRRHGVELVTVSDGFDLNGPAAEVVLAVMAWAAKMERLAINERISAARERLESEGRPWGRPARLTGADLDRIRAYRTEGRSLRQIAVAMKVPLATVARTLRRGERSAEGSAARASEATHRNG